MDSDEDSRISSTNSMSRYGSESPLHSTMMFMAEQQARTGAASASAPLGTAFQFQFLESDENFAEDENVVARKAASNRTSTSGIDEEDELDERFRLRRPTTAENDSLSSSSVISTRRFRERPGTIASSVGSTSGCRMRVKTPMSAAFNYSRKARRTSSDNISTPNSGRSRSPSILSSDYIAEEENGNNNNNNEVLKPNVEVEAKNVVDTKEVSMTNIDKVCQLIHELKEQDLRHHKQRIEQEVSE